MDEQDEYRKANHTKTVLYWLIEVRLNPLTSGLVSTSPSPQKGREYSAYENDRAETIIFQSGEIDTCNTLVSQSE